MGQCQVVQRLPCAGCRGRGDLDAAADGALLGAPPAPAQGAAALPDALKRFRNQGLQAVASQKGTDHDVLWATAYDIVEAILLGVQAHHAEYVHSVSSGRPEQGDVSITVTFTHGPIVGEFATRSRQPCELHLGKTLKFSLGRADDGSLVLQSEGLFLAAMPEVPLLRERLRQIYGKEFGMGKCGDWWVANRETEYPLQFSKLRRVCDSLPGTNFIPKPLLVKAFWGYLHAVDRIIDGFEISLGAKGVEVSGLTRLTDPVGDASIAATAQEMCHEMLKMHRSVAERFAPSTVAMAAFFEGRAVGQSGGDATKIVKLFSAAKSWGVGDDSWHVHDDTWTCVDKKDMFGRIVEEQGRIIWRTPEEASKPAPRAAETKAQVIVPAPTKVRGKPSPCASMLVLLMTMAAMATTVAAIAQDQPF